MEDRKIEKFGDNIKDSIIPGHFVYDIKGLHNKINKIIRLVNYLLEKKENGE